jgi:hypothetical protein
MKSNSEKASLTFREVEGLLQAKKPADNPLVKDQGFGFYYPNAVAVSSRMMELFRKEVASNVSYCTT